MKFNISKIDSICYLIGSLLVSFLLFFKLDLNQDEFLPFFNLKNWDSNYNEVTYNFGYNFIKKMFPFLNIEIFQPYYYVGNIQSFLFTPFYFLFPILLAKFWYSYLNLLLIFYLLRKILNNEMSNIIYFFIPLYITVLHDAGPVVTHLEIFLGINLLTKLFFKTSQTWKSLIFLSVILSLLIIGLFDKIFLIYLLPGIFLFSLAGISFKQYRYKLTFLIILYALFTIFAFIFVKIGIWRLDYNTKIPVYQWMDIFSLNNAPKINTIKSVFQTFDIAFFVNRHFNVDYYFNYLPFGIIGPVLLIFLIIRFYKIGYRGVSRALNLTKIFDGSQNTIAMYFFSLMALLFVFVLLGGIGFNHHTIYLFIPILAIYVELSDSSAFKKILRFTYFSQVIFLGIIFFTFNKNVLLEMSYNDLHKVVNEGPLDKSKPTVVNFNGWSYYFIESLNKDRKSKFVSWCNFNNKIEQSRLIGYCRKKKYNLVNIYDNINNEKLVQANVVEISKFSKKVNLINNNPKFMIYEFIF